MNQTVRVINAFDDARSESIEYWNRFWLRGNVERYNLVVCIEDLFVDYDDIQDYHKESECFIIQDGSETDFENGFDREKEALLIRRIGKYNYAFLCSPE